MITLTAKITLADGTEIAINKRNVLSIDQSIIDRGDITLPSWGIISNGGSIRFNDFINYDGKTIKQYANNRQLVAGLPVEIYLNDTTAKTHLSITNFVTKEWDYDSNSKEIATSLTDELEQWQDIVVQTMTYNAETPKNFTGEQIYYYWYGKTPAKYKMKSFSELDEKTQTALRNFKTDIFLPKSTNLWAGWNEFCVAVQSYIFRNKKGETIFTCRN